VARGLSWGLSRSWFPGATVAFVLVSPCLVAGLVADDDIHVLRLSRDVGMAGSLVPSGSGTRWGWPTCGLS
jgi:hypothetical protein